MNVGKVLSLSTAAALLFACGGSDNGGTQVVYSGPTTAISIDSTAKIGQLATALSGGMSSFSGVGTGTATVIAVASAAPRASVKAALDRAFAARAAVPAVLTGVVNSASQACQAGGSVTVTASDGDNDPNTTAAGDWFQVTFKNCVETAGGSRMNGGLRVDVIRTDGADFTAGPDMMVSGFAYSMKLSIQDFVTVNPDGSFSGIDGDVTETLTADAATQEVVGSISGSKFAAISGTNGKVTDGFLIAGPGGAGNYSAVSTEYYPSGFTGTSNASGVDLDGRICTTSIGGCIDVVTNPALWKNDVDAYPYQGTITISDARQAFVEITAVNGVTGDINLRYDLDGTGGNAPVGPIATTWTCLETPDATCPPLQ